MMWGFASNAIASIGLKENLVKANRACSDCSDDEVGSNASREEGLECPVCWESFNIVENVPYVLWGGHTLCQNCVLGLQSVVLKFPAREIKIPFFISCPWCHLLLLQLVNRGNLKFPRKNLFLLWMVESLNGDQIKFGASSGQNQPARPPRYNLILGNQAGNSVARSSSCADHPEQHGSHNSESTNLVEGHPFPFTSLWIYLYTFHPSSHWSSYSF